MMTIEFFLEIESDHVMYLSALNMRSDFFLSSTYHYLTED